MSKCLSTIDYLFQNKNGIESGIVFTFNDLAFIRKHKLKEITVNEHKKTKEILTEMDILNRLSDLFKIASQSLAKDRFTLFEAMFRDQNIPIN